MPDSGEYHPRRWSRQRKIVNLKRKEGKDENKRKSKPYEKITNGEKQIVESKNGEEWRKRKESAGVDEKTQSQTERQEQEMAGLVHESE